MKKMSKRYIVLNNKEHFVPCKVKFINASFKSLGWKAKIHINPIFLICEY